MPPSGSGVFASGTDKDTGFAANRFICGFIKPETGSSGSASGLPCRSCSEMPVRTHRKRHKENISAYLRPAGQPVAISVKKTSGAMIYLQLRRPFLLRFTSNLWYNIILNWVYFRMRFRVAVEQTCEGKPIDSDFTEQLYKLKERKYMIG